MFDAFHSSKASNVSKREACWRYVSLCKSWLWWQQGQGQCHLGAMRFCSGSQRMFCFRFIFSHRCLGSHLFCDRCFWTHQSLLWWMWKVERRRGVSSPNFKLIALRVWLEVRRVAKCLESIDCHDCLEVDGSWVTLFTLGKLDMFYWKSGLLLLFAKFDPHPCQII